jgi:hypothetical protein
MVLAGLLAVEGGERRRRRRRRSVREARVAVGVGAKQGGRLGGQAKMGREEGMLDARSSSSCSSHGWRNASKLNKTTHNPCS